MRNLASDRQIERKTERETKWQKVLANKRKDEREQEQEIQIE